MTKTLNQIIFFSSTKIRIFWRFFENWYTDLTSKIKWNGLLSHKIVEKKQGGIWSLLYVNSLLDFFEKNQIVMHIEPIFCGIPTVADDVTLQFSKNRQLSPSNPALFISLNRSRCHRTLNALGTDHLTCRGCYGFLFRSEFFFFR
jgi:hypothetical protein